MRDGKIDALIITEGHPFQEVPFFAVFDADPGLSWMRAKQPGAQQFFDPRVADLWDAYVFYDLPGISFDAAGIPTTTAPSPELVRGFDELCDAGHGFVFLHHALGGWPAWPGLADALGARFLYEPGSVAGHDWPASGYRPDTWHRLSVVDAHHPVTAGLGAGFDLVDELYLMPVDEARVRPLLRSDFAFDDAAFSSVALAMQGRPGRRDGWSHPHGSNVMAWSVRHRESDIVGIQCGGGPSAYANAGFRRLLANAIRWVSRHRTGGPALPYPG